MLATLAVAATGAARVAMASTAPASPTPHAHPARGVLRVVLAQVVVDFVLQSAPVQNLSSLPWPPRGGALGRAGSASLRARLPAPCLPGLPPDPAVRWLVPAHQGLQAYLVVGLQRLGLRSPAGRRKNVHA